MNNVKKGFRYHIAALAFALLLTACSSEQNTVRVDRWVVGILPDQGKAKILQTYRPLMDYVRDESGIDYEIRVPDNYQQLLDWFEDKTINVALFGGVTFVKAYVQQGAVPVVRRDVDGSFSHYILVRSDIPVEKISDLKGLRFAFGPHLSTSGHVMPRYELQESGINPEDFFGKIYYSNAHDKTALMIQDGIADAGAANTGVIREMYKRGELDPDKVRVLQHSLPYHDYVWAVQKGTAEADVQKFRGAFLKLDREDKKHRIILDRVGANYYLPALLEDNKKILGFISEHDSGQ